MHAAERCVSMESHIIIPPRSRCLAAPAVLGWPLSSTLNPVRIQFSPWASSTAVAYLADVVLREKIGYDVELILANKSYSTLTYGHLADEQLPEAVFPDIDFELWPELPHKKVERTDTLSAQCGSVNRAACVSPTPLPLGYAARSGWFLPKSTLPSALYGEFVDSSGAAWSDKLGMSTFQVRVTRLPAFSTDRRL